MQQKAKIDNIKNKNKLKIKKKNWNKAGQWLLAKHTAQENSIFNLSLFIIIIFPHHQTYEYYFLLNFYTFEFLHKTSSTLLSLYDFCLPPCCNFSVSSTSTSASSSSHSQISQYRYLCSFIFFLFFPFEVLFSLSFFLIINASMLGRRA